MSTQKIWDLHMRVPGPLDEEAAAGMKQLAESIAQEPGVIWKIWTYEHGSDRFGSTYLFKDLESLESYKAMHMKRLEAFGVIDITDHVFDIMEDLSRINNAPIGSEV
ncbi:monooxygenase [Leisingera sp. SS27]|uniref:monooxygenase n=1 Tax=Leisingera sp. SS27 TaxID=2979462 RepID=UPI002330D18E|nr:monooxygenase [Leisingera sp. SS27]MDC0657593.1 monooxygenase [Leisingera sp. SS27]